MEEAKRRLRFEGVIYESLKEDSRGIFEGFFSKRQVRLGYKELAIICRDLSIYIRSGVSIVNAIKLASNQYKNHATHMLFFKTLSTFLSEGKNFFQALELQNVYALPAFFKQSVKVSENSGILGDVLMELSHYLKEQDRISKQISNAMAYPLFVLCISLGIVIFMISYIVPKITSIFSQMGQELPTMTRLVIATGDFFASYGFLMLFGIVGCVILWTILLKRIATLALWKDRIILKIPLFGGILYRNEMGRFAYVSYILMRSGVPFAKTLNLASKIFNNRFLQEIFEESSQRVVEGDKLSHALNKYASLIDGGFIQGIALGEETSELASMLENLSMLYFEENKDKTAVMMSLLEPALMLFVGLVVGFIIMAMLLPIFSLNIGM